MERDSPDWRSVANIQKVPEDLQSEQTLESIFTAANLGAFAVHDGMAVEERWAAVAALDRKPDEHIEPGP